uniref:Dynamin GTPase n=1 Tax=Lotharella globosa TaxID=91324 RepID=A0A7S3Z876_9EUKA
MGTSPVQLPQLVVIGSQSAGKSSVLENIVGRDFLPRGDKIVTRRPLVLQLVNTSVSTGGGDQKYDAKSQPASGQEWGEFLHQKGKRFFDFEEIKAEINRETDRLTGTNKGVSDKAIHLKIFSPHVLSLSLVDLPGITKNPVGDQPANIEQQIRDMSLRYIRNPNSIIVAVSPANADLANSESLKLAKEVDPQGTRTLGVLTKLDLMDRGTDAMDVIKGKVIPLRLGFVPVVNRSQADINQKKRITEAHKSEEAFFESHPRYRQIKHRCGTPYLAGRLNGLLLGHIKKVLPQLKVRIGNMIAENQEKLDSYGLPLTGSVTNYGSILLQLISQFCTNYCNALGGRSPDVSLSELYGGARISYVFHQVFAKGLLQIQPFDRLSDTDIRTAIRNATGPRPSLFVPDVAFEMLVKRQIARLEDPSIQCVEMVHDELTKVATQCEHLVPQLKRFPKLRDQMLDCVHDLLQAQVAPTKKMIRDLVAMELSYVNTNHPDFVGGSRAVHQINRKLQRLKAEEKKRNPNSTADLADLLARDKKKDQKQGITGHVREVAAGMATQLGFGSAQQAAKPTEREVVETEIIKSLIGSYFAIVRQNITNTVPKSIMFFLVNYTKDRIQSSLVRALYKDENFKMLLSESSSISEKRRQRTELLAVLRRSLDIVNEVRDFAV